MKTNKKEVAILKELAKENYEKNQIVAEMHELWLKEKTETVRYKILKERLAQYE